MAWYAYCLTEQQSPANGVRARRPSLLEGIQGVNGASVLNYPSGEFAVVVSEYDRSSNGDSSDNALEEKTRSGACPGGQRVLPQRHRAALPLRHHLRQR